jgi:TRAP transporter 4TM/12TM fusion protein
MATATHEAAFDAFAEPRRLTGFGRRALAASTLAFSIFQLAVAAFSPLSSLVTRSLHVAFLMLLAFLLYPAVRRVEARIPWYDWLLALGAFGLGFYHWIFEADLVQRAGQPSTVDIATATVVVVLVFEASRRVIGAALPIMSALFLAYGLFGQYLPGALGHRPFGYDQVMAQLFLATEGIYGIPTFVSATYIFLFILFGGFLEHSGMTRLFNTVALGFVGHATGGPAKAAVVSSGFMGMISGSGVANVLTIGSFTIPLMKRFGYSSTFAGAVEATASMGGQIMPPVMGAVAFIMAETLDIPYLDVCKAALVPAILYYATAFWMVHLEARRAGLVGMPRDQCPNPWQAIRQQWYLLLPLVGLVYMLFHGFTPMYAGMTGLALTAILILGAGVAAAIGPRAFRVFFWVALGLAAASSTLWGVVAVLSVVGLLVLLNVFVDGGLQTLRLVRGALIEGAIQALPVGLACAVVGVVIGILTLTGAATTFAGVILEMGRTSLLLSLVLTMIVCLVLGTGIPTIPNYIITAAIAAPALLELGVPLIVSHMFVFYFGIMADLTPPVALAALAAASIAKGSFTKIANKATQIAAAGYVVPFMAVYDPALMFQGPWLDTAYMVAKALVAIGLWGAAAIGYLWAPLGYGWRALATLGAGLLVVALPVTDAVGFLVAAVFAVVQSLKLRRAGPA